MRPFGYQSLKGRTPTRSSKLDSNGSAPFGLCRVGPKHPRSLGTGPAMLHGHINSAPGSISKRVRRKTSLEDLPALSGRSKDQRRGAPLTGDSPTRRCGLGVSLIMESRSGQVANSGQPAHLRDARFFRPTGVRGNVASLGSSSSSSVTGSQLADRR